MTGRTWCGRLLCALVLLVSAGCSLPLPSGVQNAAGVQAEQRPQDDITVIPPAPRRGQVPLDVVNGFLNAQASPAGGHAVARLFLARTTRWDDGGDLLVYDPATLVLNVIREDAQTAEVTTSMMVSATVRRDGSYAVLPAHRVDDVFRLARARGQDWRLTAVPAGLRLTPADRDRSFSAVKTWFLSPAVLGGAPEVVPDEVFLPDHPDAQGSADALVRRLVAGPSRALSGSVRTAVPAGTRVAWVEVDPGGLVQVSLSVPGGIIAGADRAKELSAQLVWTLRNVPSFTALRLRIGDQLLALPETGTADQPATAWDEYGADPAAGPQPLFYVQDRRLRALYIVLPDGPATAGEPGKRGAFAVDEVAVTPDAKTLALLTGAAPSGSTAAGSTLRMGPLPGTSFPVVLSRPGLHAPSWGSGGVGLWLLEGSAGLVRVTAAGQLQSVPIEGSPSRLTSLAVSRDGVRVALVSRGRLLVGRVDRADGHPRVVGLVEIAPSLSAVADVAWQTGTTLVAIGTLLGTSLPVRLAVDGSSLQPLDGPGLPGPARAVASSPAVTIVEAATPARLFRVTGNGFAAIPGRGRSPAFPG